MRNEFIKVSIIDGTKAIINCTGMYGESQSQRIL